MRRQILQVLNNKKVVALGVFALLVMTISATITFLYFSSKQNQQQDTAPVLAAESSFDPGTPPEDLKTLNVLLLGYGGQGHSGGYLTDVIQLAHINFETGQIALISLPRDLWVQLPTGQTAKINQAFTLRQDPNQPVASGGQVAKQMAATITGLRVDYFVAVDFVGFKRLVGEDLDGITVEVTEPLNDPWYPIRGRELDPCGMTAEEIAEISAEYSGFELEKQFPCRYEQISYQPGTVQMEGGNALKFVRSRHGSAGGDFSRSKRQHAVLQGIKNKLFSLEALDNAPEFFETIRQNVTTDLNLDIVEYLVPALRQTNNYTTNNIIISTDNVLTTSQANSGQFILVPQAGLHNWQELQAFIQTEMNK